MRVDETAYVVTQEGPDRWRRGCLLDGAIADSSRRRKRHWERAGQSPREKAGANESGWRDDQGQR